MTQTPTQTLAQWCLQAERRLHQSQRNVFKNIYILSVICGREKTADNDYCKSAEYQPVAFMPITGLSLCTSSTVGERCEISGCLWSHLPHHFCPIHWTLSTHPPVHNVLLGHSAFKSSQITHCPTKGLISDDSMKIAQLWCFFLSLLLYCMCWVVFLSRSVHLCIHTLTWTMQSVTRLSEPVLQYRLYCAHDCSLHLSPLATAPHRRGWSHHVTSARFLSLALFVAGIHARMTIGSHLMKYGWKHHGFIFNCSFSPAFTNVGSRGFCTWCVCEEQIVLAFLPVRPVLLCH